MLGEEFRSDGEVRLAWTVTRNGEADDGERADDVKEKTATHGW